MEATAQRGGGTRLAAEHLGGFLGVDCPSSWVLTGLMTTRVVLFCMPFADVDCPSLGVSLLKPLLERVGIACDVQYLNVAFRTYTDRPGLYDKICLQRGEWVFGEALFGEAWARSDRGKLDVPGPLPIREDPDFLSAMSDTLLHWCLTSLRPFAAPFVDHVMETTPWDEYDIVGFSTVFSQSVSSLALARRIKERWPAKIIAFGGPACDEEMGSALLRLFPFVDWVFSGEADLSFPQAVRQWSEGRPPEGIPGVAYRDRGEIVRQGNGRSIDLNSLPYPDFDDYVTALRRWAPDVLSSAFLSLEFSRGCWWADKGGCSFCGLNRAMRAFRCKDPERAKAEILTVRRRYRIERVHCTDTILDMRIFDTVLPVLSTQKTVGTLFVETRPTLNRTHLQAMRKAGVGMFQPGIESLDTSILAHMRKGTTLAANIQLLKWSREYGLAPHWGFLYGLPGEDRKAYERMASLIPSLVHLQPPEYIIPIRLQRFSPLFEHSETWGLRNIRAAEVYRSIYPFDQEDLDQLVYDFDCDFDGKEDIPIYTRPVKRELRTWQECWGGSDAPLLAFRQEEGGEIIIDDTRPCCERSSVKLEKEAAMAYLACDARQTFDSIAAEVRREMGRRYPGDVTVQRSLDELVSQRLMLKDGDGYLSLANDLLVLSRYRSAEPPSGSTSEEP
jgi:ribosomal peptide maturation radical SAM protein 1